MFKRIIFLILVCFCFTQAQARIPLGGEVIEQIVKSNRRLAQYKLTTRVSVFQYDNLFSAKKTESLDPVKNPEMDFLQNIVWIRDEYLGIETFSTAKELLNFSVNYYGKGLTENFSTDRIFTREDIHFIYGDFFTKFSEQINKSVDAFGIDQELVEYKTSGQKIFLQLGNQEFNLLIDSGNSRVLEINRSIQVNGQFYPYKIVFSSWKKRLPTDIKYYVNGRLVKIVRVVGIQQRGLTWARKAQVRKMAKLSERFSAFIKLK